MQSFQVENVKCGGCAKTLKNELKSEFGEVTVNLDVEPRVITLDVPPDKQETLKIKLRSLGYPLSSDELGLIQEIQSSAKSFVSCAIGKIGD